MKKKICCALICSAIMVSAMTGCGKETASSSILNEMPLVTNSDFHAASSTSESSTEEPETFSEDEVYAGISYLDALAAVRVQCGSGSVINDTKKGTFPNGGEEAWEITVTPITTSDDPITVVYYVTDKRCDTLQ